MQDFYEILGVSRSSTDDEIKKAYRALARQYHPDANPGDPEAEAHFKEVSVAYETLRDPEKRRRYDTFGAEGLGQAAGFGGAEFGLNDLFDAFFGGDAFGGRGRGPSGPPRGQDAETVMELTLEEAAFGATRTLDLTMPVECETCDGSGAAEGTHSETCPTCAGHGEVRQTRRSILGQIVTAGVCPQCEGVGSIVPSPCPDCRGEGRLRGSRHLDVEVPPGIDDGQRLRLTGRGPAGPRGGGPGDLYVGVRLASDGRFERHGDDLFRRQRIALTQAALGTRLQIETLDGPEELVVQPGTQPGAVQRIRGRGMPSLRNGRRGDLVVELDVEIPNNLSAEQAELLVQFAELRGEDVTSPKEHGLFSRIKSAFPVGPGSGGARAVTSERFAAASEATAAHCFVASLDPTVTIDGPDGHHLQRVRRLHVGEHITAADGLGSWRRYAIAGAEPGRLLLRAESDVASDPEARPAVAVAVALTKGTKLETVVAQLTELGVARIEPVRARRSVVRWDAARAEAAHARLATAAREAAMQCRRARIPTVAPVADLATLAGRSGLVIAARDGGPAEALPLPPNGTWTVVVGPEGGFEPGEVEALGPAAALALSPFVLRAQTAPVVAAALLVARALGGAWSGL